MKCISRLFIGVLVVMFLCSPAAAQVHTQPFESMSPWTEYHPTDTTADWSIVQNGSYPTCSPHEGTRMAEFNSDDADWGHEARISSPDLDLTGAEVAECRFWMYRDDGSSGADDLIWFQISTDVGDNYYSKKEFKRYSPTVGWEEKVIPLGYYTGGSIRIAIRGESDYGNNIFIDDLRVTKGTLPAGAEGKACSSGAECDSGICGVDPGNNGRCRAATTVCIDGHRQPVPQGTVACYGGDIATCNGTDNWSVQDCYDDCGPYVETHACQMESCVGCPTECITFDPVDCDANAYCEPIFLFLGRCVFRKADGESCSTDSHCQSNNCAGAPDGNRFCQAAGTPCSANDGSPVSGGATTCYIDPGNPEYELYRCEATGGWTYQDCATNCGFYKDVDECVGGACTQCPTSCQDDNDCKTGIPCTGNECIGDLPNGQTCQSPNQCASNFCIDGVCCADACTAPCHRCDLAPNLGTCTMLPAGQDPDDECPGTGVCDGTCNGLGGCDYPGQDTVCDVCTLCDGAGHCWLYRQAGTDPNDECPACQACNGGAPGCAPVQAGTDPLDDCDAQAESTCGLDGECNGAGACRKWAAGTECGVGSCQNGNAVFADTCDGNGLCVDGGSGSCGFYRCADATRCADSCTTHATCIPSGYCAADGSCQPDLGEGASCQDVVYAGQIDDAACMGQYCFDDNFDGDGAFCTSDPAACVHDGMVFSTSYVLCASGNSFYRVCIGGAQGWGAQVSCAAGLCDAGGGDGSGYRSGGSCNSGPGGGCTAGCTSCEPYMAADASSCRSTCTLQEHCWPGYECRGGHCEIPQGIGESCQSQADCDVGTCTDGVCCNDSCAGPCRSCNLPGHEGFCTMATEGTDPDDECATLPAESCQTTGVCDGHGACSLWPSGTDCGEAHCSGAILKGAAACNGAGDCIAGQDTDCRPGRCIGDACVSTCTSHAECDPTGFCGAAGNCLVDLADGESCEDVVLAGLNDDPACLGGFCFEDSWNEEGAFCASEGGVCVADGSVYDPGFRLCSGDGWYRVCIGGEDGWGGEIQCAGADICDAGAGPGSGVKPAETCTSGFTGGCSSSCVSCFPYLAESPGVCATSCVEDADCWAGYVCNTGACERGAGLGDTCTTDADCTGWICVDGVCCSTACDGDCRVCNNPAYLGVCVYVQEGTDPSDDCEEQQDPCGLTGVCDGEGACAFQPEGTQCAPQSCTDGVLTAASYCDGDGNCVEGKPTDCPSGACDGDRCAPVGVDGADGGDGGADGGLPDGGDAGNRPPVAEAGPTQEVSPGTLVELDGGGSRDPDGGELTYLWKQSSGPEEVSLSGATTERPSFTPRRHGVYVFRLVVNDGTYDSAPDFTEVRVEAGAGGCGCGRNSGGGIASLALLLLLGMLVRWGRRS
jgi:hypothetical protein